MPTSTAWSPRTTLRALPPASSSPDKLGFKSVAVIDDSTPYGQGLAEQFVKAFEAKGGTVAIKESVQSNEVDFNALVTRTKDKKPEAIYFAGGLNQGALLSKQSKEAGL